MTLPGTSPSWDNGHTSRPGRGAGDALSAALADPAVDALWQPGAWTGRTSMPDSACWTWGSLQATGQAANQRDVVAGQRQEDEEAERLAAAAAEAARRAIEQDAARRELAAAELALEALRPSSRTSQECGCPRRTC